MASPSSAGTILVTGLIGFTGDHLGPALAAEGYEVHDLDCDIRDPRAVTERVLSLHPDVVIHLAGIANVAHADSSEMYHVNVIGSRNLFAALGRLTTPPRNTIVASSATVYGNAPSSPITEESPLNPRNDYGVTKAAMELLIGMWGERLPYTILRPFNYTGPGQTTNFVIPKIVDHFRRRAETIDLGNTHVVREYGDVRRTVAAYTRLAARSGDNRIYNIATGTGVTLDEVIAHCSAITGHSLHVVVNPRFVRSNEVHTLIGSPARIESYLGPLPRYSIEETLRWMLET